MSAESADGCLLAQRAHSELIDSFYDVILLVKITTHHEFWLGNGIDKTCPWKKYILLYY